MVKLSLTTVVSLIAVQNIICKDLSSKAFENHHSLQKPRHSPMSHKKHNQYKSHIKTRNEFQRCTIFCPIIIIFPNSSATSTSRMPLKNATRSSISSSKISTKQTSTSKFSTKSLNKNSRRSFKDIKKEHRHNANPGKRLHKTKPSTRTPIERKMKGKKLSPQRKPPAITTKVIKPGRKLGVRKYSYHDLNSHQKHLLLKQLNLGNSHGTKAYEFREISTSFCRVICLEENNLPSNTPVPQRASTTENEDTGEDSYEEGEDTPIEATYRPHVPQSVVIGGIRPFGAVNFNGLDDFGPNGDPAKDFPRPGDKHH